MSFGLSSNWPRLTLVELVACDTLRRRSVEVRLLIASVLAAGPRQQDYFGAALFFSQARSKNTLSFLLFDVRNLRNDDGFRAELLDQVRPSRVEIGLES